MINTLGQHFDLAQPGKHVLLRLPQAVEDEESLLMITAEVQLMSSSCADIYIQAVNMTGNWVETLGSNQLSFYAQHGKVFKQWYQVGKIQVKVIRGRTQAGISYLNLLTKGLGRVGMKVGGLLGQDDHSAVTVRPAACLSTMML